jgi:hypothetical protein
MSEQTLNDPIPTRGGKDMNCLECNKQLPADDYFYRYICEACRRARFPNNVAPTTTPSPSSEAQASSEERLEQHDELYHKNISPIANRSVLIHAWKAQDAHYLPLLSQKDAELDALKRESRAIKTEAGFYKDCYVAILETLYQPDEVCPTEKQQVTDKINALRERLAKAEALLDSGLIHLSGCIHKQVDLRKAIQRAIDYETSPSPQKE